MNRQELMQREEAMKIAIILLAFATICNSIAAIVNTNKIRQVSEVLVIMWRLLV